MNIKSNHKKYLYIIALEAGVNFVLNIYYNRNIYGKLIVDQHYPQIFLHRTISKCLYKYFYVCYYVSVHTLCYVIIICVYRKNRKETKAEMQQLCWLPCCQLWRMQILS